LQAFREARAVQTHRAMRYLTPISLLLLAACSSSSPKSANDGADAATPPPPPADAGVDVVAPPSGPGRVFFSIDDGSGTSLQRHAYVFALDQKPDVEPRKLTSGASDDDEVQDVSDDGKRLALVRSNGDKSIVLLDLETAAETVVTTCVGCYDVRFGGDGNLWYIEGTQTGTLRTVAPAAGAQPSDKPFDLDSRCQIEGIAMSRDKKQIFVDVIDAIGLGCPEEQIGLYRAPLAATSLGTPFVVNGIADDNGTRIHRVVPAVTGDRIFFLGSNVAGETGAWSIPFGGTDLRFEAETVGYELAVSDKTVFTIGSQKTVTYVAMNPIGGASPQTQDVMMDPRPGAISALVFSAR
jgi:hypothetical protein